MSVIVHSNIPASTEEREKEQPFRFSLSGFDFYNFEMQGLPIVDFHKANKLTRLAILWELNSHYTKEELKKILAEKAHTIHVLEYKKLIDLVYEKCIPIPLLKALRFIWLHNKKYWRYPKQWAFSLRQILYLNMEADDLAETADYFLAYTIKIKKKLETILNNETGSSTSIQTEKKTSQRPWPQDAAPVFLTAGAQLFGRQKVSHG